MADILSSFGKYLQVKETSADNVLFKLFSKGSVGIFLVSSLIVVATEYFGDPIICSFKSGVDGDLAKQHCWIHGSSHIPAEFRNELSKVDCISKEEDEYDTLPDTAYYQWVVFVLVMPAQMNLSHEFEWKIIDVRYRVGAKVGRADKDIVDVQKQAATGAFDNACQELGLT